MTGEARRIRVLIADDHLVFRFGLVSVIEREADMQVVAEAASGAAALELFRTHRPDITLMDLRMPGGDGPAAVAAIRGECPDARILLLTIYRGHPGIDRALRAGACGYLLKDTLAAGLLAAIRAVHAGQEVVLH
jgi:two-component system, NarL family, response regulator